jgi:hypothetical protein
MGQSHSEVQKPVIADGYPYKVLGRSKRVRLLVLQPGKKDDNISFTLRHVSLKKPPKYEAISYTWGDPSVTRTVYCSGFPMQVTVNLFMALRRMRYPDRTRALWADAVCIDQRDIQERGSQVQLMPDIYSKAERVLIWLGVRADDQAALDDFLFRIRTVDDAIKRRFGTDGAELDYLPENAAQLRDEGGPNFFAIDWAPFLQLMRTCPWWQRKWVIQEVALAKAAVLLIGERSELNWDVFFKCVMERTAAVDAVMLEMEEDAEVKQSMRNYFMVQTLRGPRGALPISFVVEASRGFRCSDPRDHVYALLSLSSDASTPGARFPIVADYTKHAVEVFTNLALGEILDRNNLAVLSLAGCASEELGLLPSWVLDLTVKTFDARLATLLENFKAGGDPRPGAWLVRDERTLVLRGRFVGIAESLAPALSEIPGRSIEDIFGPGSHDPRQLDDQSIMAAERKLRWLEGFKLLISRGTGTLSEAQYATLDRCLRCELNMFFRRTKISMAAHIQDYENRLRHNALGIAVAAADETKLPVVEDETVDGDLLEGDVYSMLGFYEKLVSAHSSSRRLCLMDDGRVGLVPMSARANDMICIVVGGQVPFVVRPTVDGSSYRLIGECYMSGIMDGEALMTGYECDIVLV